MKNKLPERQFYSFNAAAEKLGCGVNDLLHFAQTGNLHLSAYIECVDNLHHDLIINSTHSLNTHNLDSDIFSIGPIELIKEPNLNSSHEPIRFHEYSFDYLSGVFFISPLNLIALEFDEGIDDVDVFFISPRTPTGSDFTFILNTLEQKILVKRKNLCIHAEDLRSFIENPTPLPDFVTGIIDTAPRATIHQFNMMYSLLKISGLTDDDIYISSPSELNNRLMEIGTKKGVMVPQPDKATWGKWREKFRR